MCPTPRESTDVAPTDGEPPASEPPPAEADAEPTSSRATDAGSAGIAATAVADRRRFLQALSASAVSTSVAGCGQLDLGGGTPLDDLSPGDRTDYSGAFRFGDAYRMRVTRPGDGAPLTVARFDGDDRYLRLPENGAEPAVESYIVDGDGYVVVDGDCTRYPDVDSGTEALASVAEQPGGDTGTPELEVTETTSLDGREMLVLTVPAADVAAGTPSGPADGPGSGQNRTRTRDGNEDEASMGTHGRMTYYVDAETRYPRRLETGATVVDYRSWGDVEPITVPDLDCTTVE
jgi:hypothetical protein